MPKQWHYLLIASQKLLLVRLTMRFSEADLTGLLSVRELGSCFSLDESKVIVRSPKKKLYMFFCLGGLRHARIAMGDRVRGDKRPSK